MWIAAKIFFCSISASIFLLLTLLWLLNHASLCLKVNCTTTLWTSWSQLSFVLYNSLFIKVLVHMIVQSLKSIVEKHLRHTSLQFTFFLYTWSGPQQDIWLNAMQSSYDAENVSRLVISIYDMTHPSLSLQALPSEIKVQ